MEKLGNKEVPLKKKPFTETSRTKKKSKIPQKRKLLCRVCKIKTISTTFDMVTCLYNSVTLKSLRGHQQRVATESGNTAYYTQCMVYGHYIGQRTAVQNCNGHDAVHMCKTHVSVMHCLWWFVFLVFSTEACTLQESSRGCRSARAWPSPHGPVIQFGFGNDHPTSPLPLRLHKLVHRPVGAPPDTLSLDQEQPLVKYPICQTLAYVSGHYVQGGETCYERNTDPADYIQKITPKVAEGKPRPLGRTEWIGMIKRGGARKQGHKATCK